MKLKIGSITVGEGCDVAIQSMTNTYTADVESTIKQALEIIKAGADMVRVAVPDFDSAKALKKIKEKINVPIVADIHFDHRLAIESIKSGVDMIRINPGNIGPIWKVKELTTVAKERNIPIRVGANTGSLPKDLEGKMERWKALAESALREVRIIESVGYDMIMVSVKSSDPIETIRANEYVRQIIKYPLHIGVTEAGIYSSALIKSSFALGYLLYKGIGDVVRISIAGDPIREVYAARKLLAAVGLRKEPEVVACPTCARTVLDVEGIATKVEEILFSLKKPVTFSVLGCFVNGVGEGKHADAGIAGVDGNTFVAFKKGEFLGKYRMEELEDVIKALIAGI